MNDPFFYIFGSSLTDRSAKHYNFYKIKQVKTTMTRFQGFLAGILAVSIMISMPSCKNKKSSQDPGVDQTEVDLTDDKENIIQEISEYPLPTSFEVTKLLIDAGASYILDLCNHVDNVDKYLDLKSKALNLGVYGADLSYAATYNQTQETMQYLQASAKLIDELQISSGFNEDLVKRVDANLDNLDSLIIIISDSFYDTYKYLTSNEQDDLSILVMAGSWIEALYISSQISIISQSNEEIVDIITEQNSSLEKLLEVMEPIKEGQMASDIYTDLEGLHELFKSVDGRMTQEQLDELTTRTENLRNEIVS